jgi:hypothetical protein
MKGYGYIPFASNLGTLRGPELAALKEVGQGWYVEYSEALADTPQLGKQLSSFANQSGGWLFIGVKGQDESTMNASSFPGIPVAAVGQALKQLREAASAHVTPEVYFETQVIEGPVPEISLAEGRCLIVIGIPEGAKPPYVHSSGQVYARTAHGSEPAAGLDRRALSVLHSRAKKARQRLADFLSLGPMIAEHERRGPVRAYVYLLSDPFLARDSLGLSHDRFAEVMRSQLGSERILPEFDSLFTTSDGYIARHVRDTDPLSEGLAFRWWANGNARVSIPIDTCDVSKFPLQSDPRRSDFVRMLRGQSVAKARIADFSGFLTLLASVTGKYLQLREVLALRGTFWGKLRFCDAWRAAPFINLRQYIESIKVDGFPVIQDDDFYAPPGLASDDLIKMQTGEHGGIRGQSVLLALRLAVNALRAVGIDFDRFIKDDPQGFLHELAESMNFVVEEPPEAGN